MSQTFALRGKEVKERIIDECISLFNEKGCHFTLDDIEKNLKISRKTVYKYFLSKQEIIMSIIDGMSEEIREKQRAIYEDGGLSTKEKLLRALTVETKYERRIHLERVSELEQSFPEVYEFLRRSYEREWQIVTELLLKAKAEGIVREDANIEITKGLLQSGMQMLTSGDFLARSGLSYHEALTQVVYTVIGGIEKSEEE